MQFNNNSARNKRPLHTRLRRFVLRDTHDGPTLFDEREVTYLDDEHGAQTIEEATIYQAGCGHLVGLQGPAELISSCGYCQAKSLCFRCGDLRCRRCLKILCQDCAKLIDEAIVYCPDCRIKVLAKRMILSTACGLHKLLSSELK